MRATKCLPIARKYSLVYGCVNIEQTNEICVQTNRKKNVFDAEMLFQ